MTSAEDDAGLLDKEELEDLRAAVAALRRSIDSGLGKKGVRGLADRATQEARRVGDAAQEHLGDIDLMGLASELRERLSFFSAEPHSPDVDPFGYEPEALRRALPLLDFLFERWWRITVSGAEHVPSSGRTLFVANRSGVLPYDGLMVAHALAREFGDDRRPRFLVADWLASLPFVQPRLARLGGVRACAENTSDLLRQGHGVVVFPEGQKGALKLFHDRYRLQRFARGGFVSIAVRERAAIVPVSVVGAEEVHPVLYQSRFASRLLGLPALVTPTFPHLGPLGLVPLPSQWRISFGEPYRFDEVELERADDPLYVNQATERIRAGIQKQLEREIRQRGGVF